MTNNVVTRNIDMADIRGLSLAKRALEVMVAGGFNLLLHGPPGVGKTMLARRAAGLFPPLSKEAACVDSDGHRWATEEIPDPDCSASKAIAATARNRWIAARVNEQGWQSSTCDVEEAQWSQSVHGRRVR